MSKQTKAAMNAYREHYRWHFQHIGEMDSQQLKQSADTLRALRARFQVEQEAERFGQQVRG